MYPRNDKEEAHPILSIVESYKLEKTGDFSDLKGISSYDRRVGLVIDGMKLLEMFEKKTHEAEPLCVLTSSIPSTTYQWSAEIHDLVANITNHFKARNETSKAGSKTNGTAGTHSSDAGIIPSTDLKKIMIVFDGCPMNPEPFDNSLSFSTNDTLSLHILSTDGRRLMADEKANQYSSRFSIDEDVESFVIRFLRKTLKSEKVVEVMRAPYVGWAQISSFFSPSNLRASEVYGCIELLAFPGIERVITNISSDGKFTYVTKLDLLEALCTKYKKRIDERMLSQIILMCRPQRVSYPDFVPDKLVDFLMSLSSEDQVMRFLNDSAHKTTSATLHRSLSTLESPVMTSTGEVRPLREVFEERASHTLVKIYGKPLPDKMYYCLGSGLLIPAAFGSVSQCAINDPCPRFDTKHFRERVDFIMALRTHMLRLLYSSALGAASPTFKWFRAYMRNKNPTPLNIPSPDDLHHWNLPELPDDTKIYFSNVLQYDKCVVLDVNEKVVMHSKASTLAAIHLRMIDLLGHISHRRGCSSELSHVGQALQCFECPTLSEYGLLFVEMIRTRIFTDKCITVASSRECHPEIKYPNGVLFAARVLSIVHINVSGPWTGPIDTEIVAFGSCSRMICRTLRTLIEVLATNFFLERRTTLPLKRFPEVAEELPFNCITEFNAGFLVAYMLMTPNSTLESLQLVFPQLYALESDLTTLRYFWNKACAAFILLLQDENEDEDRDPSLRDHFTAADELLKDAFNRVLGTEAAQMNDPVSYQLFKQ